MVLVPFHLARREIGREVAHPDRNVDNIRHRVARIVRDYVMLDRRESPQYFPEIQRNQ
jgi:hypothetical protein